MRAVVYARYSSDKQSDRSIEDQVRLCRERIAADGHTVAEVYSDHAVSGATLLRPGIQAVMQDAMGSRFDLVYAEALDRISRDQEDVAGFFKRMRHADVRIITLGEGEISELHVGLKGTMNALFLADLANRDFVVETAIAGASRPHRRCSTGCSRAQQKMSAAILYLLEGPTSQSS